MTQLPPDPCVAEASSAERPRASATTLGVVCVHYQPSFVRPTLDALARIVSVPAHFVLVANQESTWRPLHERVPGLDARCEVLRHDNSGMEFGGYQTGLNHLLGSTDPDWILIANDTFATHGSFGSPFRDRLQAELKQARSHPVIVGQVESLPRSYLIEGMRTHRWITTNLFAINRAAVQVLGGRIYRPEVEPLVNAAASVDEFFSAAVDPVLRAHLQGWLFETGSGIHWYASSPLTGQNAQSMARKARSILQEKYLSARLEASGAEFADLKHLNRAQRLRRHIERRAFAITRRF